MTFRAYEESELQAVRKAVAQTGYLSKSGISLMGQLANLAATDYPSKNWGLVITATQDPHFFDLMSPYGKGRARLELSVGEKGNQAVWIIEKQCRNSLDQVEWSRVWKITLNSDGIFGGSTEEPLPFNHFDDDHSITILVLSILNSLATN